MDRRNFLKISLAGSALALLPSGLRAASLASSAASGSYRVSVVRRNCFDDLQSCYLDDPEAGACPVFSDDFSEILTLGDKMPSHLVGKFCPKAWSALSSAASDISDCADSAQVRLASCGDPTRPVVFKIEKV